MKKHLNLFVAVLILFSAQSFYSQGLKLGLTGGLSSITAPEMLTKDISEGGLGFGSGLNVGLKGKFSLPVLPLKITGHAVYNMFSSSGDMTVSGVVVNNEADFTMVTVGFGAEYSIIPGPLSPYLALDYFYTSIGELTYKQTYPGGSNENVTDSFSRTGMGIGAGVEFTLLPTFDIDISAKYNLNNLTGKDDGEESLNTIAIQASLLFKLF
ncbi:MAG: outer membrane beta-barrel protein [Melioribacteraceae bacterium]|nr:outer membrane beta-barrel protein [Melioribacteraceae bacterium]MCF8354587.1 outer membrane beta-barrel protein [Melioribacteraceae bacterium]MCF8394939.1 outer membrane beta-barrel protein [Melioribacteraceae bacterium]MCF8420164.1 outer membrane beta-barrel protein [Melioribacteraceae bacterium]